MEDVDRTVHDQLPVDRKIDLLFHEDRQFINAIGSKPLVGFAQIVGDPQILRRLRQFDPDEAVPFLRLDGEQVAAPLVERAILLLERNAAQTAVALEAPAVIGAYEKGLLPLFRLLDLAAAMRAHVAKDRDAVILLPHDQQRHAQYVAGDEAARLRKLQARRSGKRLPAENLQLARQMIGVGEMGGGHFERAFCHVGRAVFQMIDNAVVNRVQLDFHGRASPSSDANA